MKIAVILNGVSLKKKFFYDKIMPDLQKAGNIDVFETQSRHDAIFLASKAVEKGYSIILAAGGDGTVNQVLNGMLKGREDQSLPILGIIPIGSGNDFARAIKVSTSSADLLKLIEEKKRTLTDVGKVQFRTEDGGTDFSYFLNVVDAGMGPEVVSRMDNSDRIFGSGIAYYSAILSTFSNYKAMAVQISTEHWKWSGKLNSLAIGNGKYYGHGLCIAPDAKIDDGEFSTFICGDTSKAEFIWYSMSLKTEKKIVHPKVSYNSAKRLEISSEQTCLIEADGELLGQLPATVEIIPARLNILC